MSTYAKYADKYKARLRTRSTEVGVRSSFGPTTGMGGGLLAHKSLEASPNATFTPGGLTPPRPKSGTSLMMDRNAYMGYLEV